MQLEDPEHVKTWRIGSQIVYALLVEAHYPGHKQGTPNFIALIKSLNSENSNDECITAKDTVKMFDIVVTENQRDLLSHIFNHPYIRHAHFTSNTVRNALKKAIRVGSDHVLNFLIEQNVPLLSEQNKFEDLKSLVFNILKSIEIGHRKKEIRNIIIATQFWNYLSSSMYHLYHIKQEKQKEKSTFSDNWNNEMKKQNTHDTDDDALSVMRSDRFMMHNALVINSIYKYIISLSGHSFAVSLFPVLQFLCEHYYTFDDETEMLPLYELCKEDTLFDCSRLNPFSLKPQSALQQIRMNLTKTKERTYVKLFWSQYVLVRLINDFLGIDVHKIRNKRSQRNVNLEHKSDEYRQILDCICYLVSNGCAEHISDVIMPLITEYRNTFSCDDDGDNVKSNDNMEELCKTIKIGENVWKLKTLQKQDVLKLFANICQNSITLPLHIISFIVSFVVL